MTLGPWYVGDTPTTAIEVHIQRDGEPVQMDGYSSAEVLLFDAGGNPATWNAAPTIDPGADVVTINPPTISPFTSPGLYTLYIRLSVASGGTETFFVEYIRISQLGGSPGWTSVARVRSITGANVTEDHLDESQSVIELYAGRTFASTNDAKHPIKAKDQGWLEKAVAYQAAWQSSQPGYIGRHGIKEINQDGAQIIYAGSAEPNNTALIMLSPLARRALKNVSWMRTRSIKIRAPKFDSGDDYYGNWKTNDNHPGWKPL